MRAEINLSLSDFIRSENKQLAQIGPELDPVATEIEKFLLESGKRLRPLFAYVGLLGTGTQSNKEIIQAVSSLELVHVCALIHDDVMDGSDTRRGALSIHKAFEKMHTDKNLVGSPAQFGVSSAILMGDLALIWSAQMLHTAGLKSEQLIQVLPVYDEMRVELMAGQYLDVYEQSLGTQSVERSLKVARYKSGKYTIERPLHFGATLGGASDALIDTYTKYGIPLGQAFQLRDDVLGVFGDPAETGKPAGDDLREGKRTVLMAMTLEKAQGTAREELVKNLGNPALSSEKIESLRTLITETGAVADVEKLIDRLGEESRAAANSSAIHPDARPFLLALAETAIRRSH